MDSFPKYIEKKMSEEIWLQLFPYWFSFCYQFSDLLFLSYKRPSVRTFFSLVIVSYNWVGSSFLLSVALFFLFGDKKSISLFWKKWSRKISALPAWVKWDSMGEPYDWRSRWETGWFLCLIWKYTNMHISRLFYALVTHKRKSLKSIPIFASYRWSSK